MRVVCLSLIAGLIVVPPGRVAAVGVPVRAQSTLPQTRPLSGRGPGLERLQKWLAVVERREPGTVDDLAIEVRSWRRTELEDLWIDMTAVLKLMRDPKATVFFLQSDGKRVPRQVFYSRPELERLSALASHALEHGDENYILKRGALLHTDIAMQLAAEDGPPVGRPDGGLQMLMRLADGRQLGFEDAAGHWELARTLLDAVTPDPSSDEMVRLWYRATAAHLQRQEQFDTAHFERALKLFPADADIVFLSGCLHETFATPGLQRVVQSAPRGVTFAVGSERTELRQAETFFRRALEINPALTEARVRLGRVLGLLGRHADAASALRPAVSTIHDSQLLYYAELFLGGAAEALGDRDQARASYEHAAALYPRAQSPRMALSQLAKRSGDGTAALSAIQQVLRLPANEGERDDPWWTYHVVQGRAADTLLAEVHRVFLAEDPR